ncbi:Sodium-dependent phosphate transport protein 2A [Bienertia sinuspersici]
MSLPQVVQDSSALGTSKPWNDTWHEAFVILYISEEHLPRNRLCKVLKVIDQDLVYHLRMENPLKIKIELYFKTSLMKLIHAVKLCQMKNKRVSKVMLALADELRAIHNGFALVAQELINVMDDPVTIYAATRIIEETHELKDLFDYINSKNIDVPGLQEHMTNYIQHASNSVLRSKNTKSQRVRVDEIQQMRDELRKELSQFDEEESQLSSLLASSKDSLQKHVTIVKDLTDSHTSLEKDITLAKEAATKLEEANKGLKDAHDSLKSFKWEP